MRSFPKETWLWFCNLMRFPVLTHTSLRDKAIAVAGRVTSLKDGKSLKVSCPVCLSLFQATNDSDLTKILAVHLSLWHPDDVELQWDIMQRRKQSILHLPSVIIGIGLAAGFGAFLASSARNRSASLPGKRR